MNISIKKNQASGGKKSVIVVSKKVAERAVDRNLIKRRIKSALEPFSRGSASFFVIAKRGVLDLSFKELKEEIKSEIEGIKKL